MIYQTVNESDFIRAFEDADRMAGFSLLGLKYLFDYYDQLSEDIGEGFKLDVIGICCDWAEYTQAELIEQFDRGIDPADYDDAEEYLEALIEDLNNNGCLLIVDHIGEDSTYLFSEA